MISTGGQTEAVRPGIRQEPRSDAVIINIAGQGLTSDRQMKMISGGQTEAVRPGIRKLIASLP